MSASRTPLYAVRTRFHTSGLRSCARRSHKCGGVRLVPNPPRVTAKVSFIIELHCKNIHMASPYAPPAPRPHKSANILFPWSSSPSLGLAHTLPLRRPKLYHAAGLQLGGRTSTPRQVDIGCVSSHSASYSLSRSRRPSSAHLKAVLFQLPPSPVLHHTPPAPQRWQARSTRTRASSS